MKKFLLCTLLISSLITISTNISVFGKNRCNSIDSSPIQDIKYQYDLSELDSETYDENGNLIENEITIYDITINGSTITPGHTKYYFPSGHSSGFYMIKDTIMRIRAYFPQTVSINIGLTNGDDTIFYGDTMDIWLVCYSTGYHKLYITNLGDETITVNGIIEY